MAGIETRIYLGISMSNKSVADYYKKPEKRKATPEEQPECIEIPPGATHTGHFLVPVGLIGGHILYLGFANHTECVGSGLVDDLHIEE